MGVSSYFLHQQAGLEHGLQMTCDRIRKTLGKWRRVRFHSKDCDDLMTLWTRFGRVTRSFSSPEVRAIQISKRWLSSYTIHTGR